MKLAEIWTVSHAFAVGSEFHTTVITRCSGPPGGASGGGGSWSNRMSPSTVGGVYLGGAGQVLDGIGQVEGVGSLPKQTVSQKVRRLLARPSFINITSCAAPHPEPFKGRGNKECVASRAHFVNPPGNTREDLQDAVTY